MIECNHASLAQRARLRRETRWPWSSGWQRCSLRPYLPAWLTMWVGELPTFFNAPSTKQQTAWLPNRHRWLYYQRHLITRYVVNTSSWKYDLSGRHLIGLWSQMFDVRDYYDRESFIRILLSWNCDFNALVEDSAYDGQVADIKGNEFYLFAAP